MEVAEVAEEAVEAALIEGERRGGDGGVRDTV
jgi:hypothetical protein